jgi:hypothetical protein
MARPDFVRLGAKAQAFEPSSIGSTPSTPSFEGSAFGAPGPPRRLVAGATRAMNRRAVAMFALVTSRAATS